MLWTPGSPSMVALMLCSCCGSSSLRAAVPLQLWFAMVLGLGLVCTLSCSVQEGNKALKESKG